MSLRHVKRALLIAVALWLVALIAEVTIFVVSPNELMGWGEKSALQPDSKFGWRLIESRTTRLRWQGYDYVVTSNSLGFPGPEYPIHKSSSANRIMAVGGGFTSAEGVDTDHAWPRVLERILNQRDTGETVEVLNFAVTGFGPGQYAAVVAEYAPIYQPDVIIAALIPNDLKKVMMPISKRKESIGFDLPNPGGVFPILTCQHLRKSMRNRARKYIDEYLRRRPNPQGYFLGQIWALEKGQDRFLDESQAVLEERLATMKTVADRVGSRLVLLLVPASVQVCSPDQLRYFPRHIVLGDATRFDLDQPQRRMAGSAVRLGIELYDLRAVFNLTPDQCFYHPNNLHWTEKGHQVVAEFVASRFAASIGDGNPE